MISNEKISSVRSKLKKGVPEGELRFELREQVFSEEEISKCFNGYQYSMKNWYLFFAIVLIAASVWLYSLLIAALGAVLAALYFSEKNKKINS
ncbi:MAG: hypothetical protein WAT19_09810 [Ferruginibacter sp.]